MDRTILENEVTPGLLKQADEVVLQKAGEDTCVSVWKAKRMADFASPDFPGKVSSRGRLTLLVSDPHDPDTIKSVQAALGLTS